MIDWRSYLLGRMDRETRDHADEALFIDPTALEAAERARAELLEDYVASRLDSTSRADVEATILATQDGRRELMISRAMAGNFGKRPVGRRETLIWFRPWSRPIIGLAVAGAMAALSFVVVNALRPVKTPQAGERPLETASVVSLDLREYNSLRGSASPVGEPPAVMLPRTASALDLNVSLGAAVRQAHFTGVLRATPGLTAIWTGQPRDAADKLLTFRVPASLLQAGRYRFSIRDSGGETVSDYIFDVRAVTASQ